jgi:hypothetical protein
LLALLTVLPKHEIRELRFLAYVEEAEP